MEKTKSITSFFKGKNKEQITPYIIILTLAAVVLISVPLIVVFLIFRRKIMAGVSRGGTKG